MKMHIISVFDSAARVYSQPQCVAAKGSAIRSFGDQVGDKESPISKHPEDFTLFYLGTYDDETATFDLITPELIARAVDYVK